MDATVVAVLGIGVREITALALEQLAKALKVKPKDLTRSAKLLTQVVVTVGVVRIACWASGTEWSSELFGAVWAASWGAHTLKTAVSRLGGSAE